MEDRNQNYTGRNWEATLAKQIPHLCSDPFLPKPGYLGSKLLVITMNAVVCTVRYGRQSAAIHFPIDLLTRWYATLSTPYLGLLAKCSISCTSLGASFLMVVGVGSMWMGKGFPVLFILACEQCRGCNVFYHIDVV